MNAIIIAAIMLVATPPPATQPTTRPAGKTKPLPATYIDENADVLGPETVAWLKLIQWGSVKASEWGKQRWSTHLTLAIALPPGVSPRKPAEIQVTCLGLIPGKAPRTFFTRQTGIVPDSTQLKCGAAWSTFAALTPAPTPANVHVAIFYDGVRVRESLLWYDATAHLKTHGKPWWQDPAIRIEPTP